MRSRNCTLYAMLADILGQSARASQDKQLSRMDNGTSILGAAPTNCICRMALLSTSIDIDIQIKQVPETCIGELLLDGRAAGVTNECHRCCGGGDSDSMLEARGA